MAAMSKEGDVLVLVLPPGCVGGVPPLHHLHEVLEVEVVLADALGVQHELQVILRDRPVAVEVERVEGVPADVLPEVPPAVQRRGQELGVVDDAVAVVVHAVHDLLQLRLRLLEAPPLQARAQLAQGQEAVLVGVEGGEGLPELPDAPLAQLPHDDLQGSLFHLALRLKAAQVLEEGLLHRREAHLGGGALDPAVLQRLLGSGPVARVALQKQSHQVLRGLGDVLPLVAAEAPAALRHLPDHVDLPLPGERRAAGEEDVHDHPAAPQVALVVVPALQDLGRGVVRGAHRLGKVPPGLAAAREPEVDDLQDVFAVDRALADQEEVLGLQVAVADVHLVHVVDGPEYVLHHDRGLDLGEVARLDDPVEELAAGAELHDQVEAPVVLERLVQLDDVRVVHQLHDGYLPLELLEVLHLRLGDRLDGTGGARLLVPGLADGPVGALAELVLLYLIVVCDLPSVAHDELRVLDAALLDVLLLQVVQLRRHPLVGQADLCRAAASHPLRRWPGQWMNMK
mmetsp:Transcript_88888/g.252010  ORF Transcript_88888/g.252010 Transcript_88888/m.252010 type:complete len:512 (-) Transcript_88888:29-1564(-)